MSTLEADTINRLQNLIELPRNKQEEVLALVLNALPEDKFSEIVNERLAAVTPLTVRTCGLACFDRVDIRPNPPDGFITIDEIAEFIGRSDDAQEQATLLYIWLNFESIKEASVDFDGLERAFDYVLTRADFQQFIG